MSTEHDETAKRLLPCQFPYKRWCTENQHAYGCPAHRRPAVAAALAEAEQKAFVSMRDDPCTRCGGLGTIAYGNTSTWRHSAGGQMITNGPCNKCWGSGEEYKPWPSHRVLADKDAEIARLKVEAKADEQSFLEIIEALDGLPIAGEKVGPKLREYLGPAEQIKRLRARLAEVEKERDAAIKSGCIAMGDLQNLSRRLIEIYNPNFNENGLAPVDIVEHIRAERDAAHAKAAPHADDDGECSRCGLRWPESEDDGEHICPPGFWTPEETALHANGKLEGLELAAQTVGSYAGVYHNEDTYGKEYQALNTVWTAIRAQIDAIKAQGKA